VCLSVQRGPAPPQVLLTLLFLRQERAYLCNVDDHLLPQSPFFCRERARLCNVGRHLLTSFSPLLLLLPPDTPGGRLIRRGLDPPLATCAALYVPWPTPARRPALRPRCSPFPLQSTVPLSPTIHCPTSPYDPPSHLPLRLTSPRPTGPLLPRLPI
jgi:hypothetical protein